MMNWSRSDEEVMLRKSALPFFKKHMPVDNLRRMRDNADQTGFSREIWTEMAKLGWTGILLPEEYGGSNFGFRGLGHILEAAGRTLAATPLLNTVACAGPLIQKLGTSEQQDFFLPAIANGKCIIALAHDEASRHEGIDIRCQHRYENGLHILNGSKSLCLDIGASDHILLLARSFGSAFDEDGLSWFLLPLHRQGIRLENIRLVDGRPAAHIHFSDVKVPDFALLGPLGGASSSYRELCDRAAAALAAEMLGSTQAAFEMTLAYLKERQQFGVAIGTFQALQHRMAQLFCELQLCEAIVQRCLAALDENEENRSSICSLAKAKLSEVFHAVSAEAIQLHGGIGMSDEHDIGFYLKRSRITAELFGPARYHRDLYARAWNF